MTTQRPNILYILADDLGSADLGCYGGQARFPVSPRLDQLAARGLRFAQGYSNSPVCSPTRFALLTGRYQYRLRGAADEPLSSAARGGSALGLPPEHPTHASLLKAAGYRTALVGKWHLGFPPEFGPNKSGFDYFWGATSGGLDYFTHKDSRGNPDLWENDRQIERSGYLTDLISERAAQWIDEQDDQAPFLLNLHYTSPHWPWVTRDDEAESRRLEAKGRGGIFHVDGGNLETYWRMIHHMDEGIGRIVDVLARKGQLDNTLIIFSSDNGGERFSNNWPFVGGKMDLLEGGIRVPVIVHWPRGLSDQARGACAQVPNLTMDWTATMLAAAGVTAAPDHPLDGLSLLPVLQDPGWDPGRPLFWRMKHRMQRAVREGDWKYLAIGEHEYLFNIAKDQREKANLIHLEPQRLAHMRQLWQDFAATMPGIPPDAVVSNVYGEAEIPKPSN